MNSGSADIAKGVEGFLNFDSTLDSIRGILSDYEPAIYLIAFVLLVVGTMRNFLYPETRRCMQNLLRAILLVAVISFLPALADWCDKSFLALAELPAARNVQFGDSNYTVKPGGGGATVRAIEEVLASKVAGSSAGSRPQGEASPAEGQPKFSMNPLDIGGNLGIAWKYIVGRGVNLVWQVLFSIYILCLLLCKFIILVMLFLQKVTVMGFKMYAPIGVAEYVHTSLKSKSITFFLTYVGIMAWPIGWSIVDAVTLGVLKSIPGPVDQNFATLNLAIVLAVPVLFWVLIGHVVAPIYVQKIVIRGGGVIQGFVGTMLSAVGAGSMALQSSALSGASDWLRNSQRLWENGRGPRWSPRQPGSKEEGQAAFAPGDLVCEDPFESAGKNFGGEGAFAGKRDGLRERLSGFGAGVLDAGAGLAARMGNAARFIGHAVAEGGGDGASLDYRALATFSPQMAFSRTATNRINRSSLQARKYLSEEQE